MNISDLLSVILIVLAIIAVISEKNRQFILLKFTRFQWKLIFLIFIYCNFLIAYSWFRNKIKFLAFFEFKDFPSTESYSYIIAVSTLFWATWKIYKGSFPQKNIEEINTYYYQLLLKEDYSTLTVLIEKYHINDVLEYLEKKKHIKIDNPTGFWQLDEEKYDKIYNEIINTSKLKIADTVLHKIIYNDAFIDNVTKTNPYFFTDIIAKLDNNELKNTDFINRYLKVLMINKNSNFFREIKNNQNLSINESYSIDEERPILYSLFNNINVAKLNQAWRGIGEPAILEIEDEIKKDYSPLRESNRESDNDTLWDYRIQNAVWYFDIMIRQTIISKINDHMWMFYYWHFTIVILKNITQPETYDDDDNIPSRNHELLEDIVSKQIDWVKCAVQSENDVILESICNCIGCCVFEIGSSEKLSDKTKHYLINWIWENYITLFGESQKSQEIIQKAIEYGFKAFRKPITSIEHNSKRVEYVRIINLVFDKKDMPKFTAGNEKERINKFKEIVIDTF